MPECREKCDWQNCNPCTGEAVDKQCGEPQCRTCKSWRKQEAFKRPNGKNNWSDLRRRCARVEGFFTLPNFLCRSYRSKEGGRS
jgi:hypothetical protein